jgi:hypothetical protein
MMKRFIIMKPQKKKLVESYLKGLYIVNPFELFLRIAS